MDRISVAGLATAIRLIREPVVVTYSYPRSHPLYGAGEECGVFVPMPVWTKLAAEWGLETPPGASSPYDTDAANPEYTG